jgi:hypothetical protein
MTDGFTTAGKGDSPEATGDDVDVGDAPTTNSESTTGFPSVVRSQKVPCTSFFHAFMIFRGLSVCTITLSVIILLKNEPLEKGKGRRTEKVKRKGEEKRRREKVKRKGEEKRGREKGRREKEERLDQNSLSASFFHAFRLVYLQIKRKRKRKEKTYKEEGSKGEDEESATKTQSNFTILGLAHNSSFC